jgi:hypothetical protein
MPLPFFSQGQNYHLHPVLGIWLIYIISRKEFLKKYLLHLNLEMIGNKNWYNYVHNFGKANLTIHTRENCYAVLEME